nr:Autoinducer 2 sensor kinase/phosphatase LuxQ [Paraburkholderia busanensis]
MNEFGGSRESASPSPAESLHDARERLSLAIDAADIGTFYCPMPMREIVWNARCKEHFWLPPDAEVDFELFYSLLHPDDRERTRDAVEAAVSAGVPYDIEYRTVSPEGNVRWIRAKGSTHYDALGNPTRFDGITIDISAQKRLEADRNRLLERERLQRQEAQEANHLKDTFIATVSHELRAPLTAILAWVELLDRRADESEFVRDGVAVIRRNVALQTRLVDDLLDMSRISTEKLSVAKRPLLVSECLLAELREVTPLADTKGVTVANALLSELLVYGDAERLRQVFANLLSNALKYTPDGGRISATTQVVDDNVVVTLTDTGEGIPENALDSVFEPFSQVDGSTTRKHGGLGLGLSIARSIIEMHGGTLVATSEGLGKGSTFTLTLPSVRAAPQTVADTSFNGPADDVCSVAGMTVLLVDDDVDALEAFAMILEDEQVATHRATSAAEARNILVRHAVDVIVSDISMPGEDGYQFVAALRAAGNRIPAVALTAFTQEEDRRKALHAGFIEHIGKPVSPQTLITKLEKLWVRRD